MGLSLPGAIGLVGTGLSLFGAEKSAKGLEKTGKMELERAKEQKAFNEIAAQEIRAVGQYQALEEKRQTELIASRAVAVAAAGGAVEDISHLIADIYGEGALRASLRLHEAESQARKLEFQGEQGVKYGEQVRDQYKDQAKGRRISALGDAFTMIAGLDFDG